MSILQLHARELLSATPEGRTAGVAVPSIVQAELAAQRVTAPLRPVAAQHSISDGIPVDSDSPGPGGEPIAPNPQITTMRSSTGQSVPREVPPLRAPGRRRAPALIAGAAVGAIGVVVAVLVHR